MVEIFKKTKVATKNKAVFNKAMCANEIKYIGINSICLLYTSDAAED